MHELIAKCFLVGWILCGFRDSNDAVLYAAEIQMPKDSKATPADKSPDKSDEIRFRIIVMGNGLTEDGTHTDYSNYESSSGKRLYETWIHFTSSSKAEKKIQELLIHAVKRLRESSEFDKNGLQVGKCVLVLRPVGAKEETEAILAWNNGSRYQEFRSSSLEDVLAFEKQHRPPAKQKEHE